MAEVQPLYVECSKCGERWKAVTFRLPMPSDEFLRLLNGIGLCPNCGAGAADIVLSAASEPAAGRSEVPQ